jgi:hypothetical protein
MKGRSLARWQLAAAMAFAVVAAGCGDDGNGPGDGTVKDYFAAVQAAVTVDGLVARPSLKSAQTVSANRAQLSLSSADNVSGSFHSGNAPSSSGGPTMGVDASTPLAGQPYRLDVTASSEFNKVYLSVDGVDGYWELDLPASVSFITLAVTLANNPPSTNFTTLTQVGGAGGVSTAARTPTVVTSLDDADIAVTLTWQGASDVDLHVIDPHENEVYYANTETEEGGRLDLDSNAGCAIDNINQETISWPQGTAPDGTYLVSVHYYDDCGQETAPYTVTVRKKGAAAQTFTGSFSGTSNDSQSKEITSITFP